MTVTNIMLVKEYITYTPLNPGNDPVPASPAATLFQQAASIQSRMKGMLGSTAGPKVESWSHSRFGDNAAKGKQGLMTVLNGLWGPPTSSAPAASEQ
jgi:PRELI-like family